MLSETTSAVEDTHICYVPYEDAVELKRVLGSGWILAKYCKSELNIGNDS